MTFCFEHLWQLDNICNFDLRRTPSICNAFRTVTVSEADTYSVIYVSLVSFGFRVQDAASIANKIKLLYMLCEQRLSKQAHYHFRLKNISRVLQALRSSQLKSSSSGENAHLSTIVVNALRQVNLLQLIPEDILIFMSFLAELFPGLSNGIGSRDSRPRTSVCWWSLPDSCVDRCSVGTLRSMHHAPNFDLMWAIMQWQDVYDDYVEQRVGIIGSETASASNLSKSNVSLTSFWMVHSWNKSMEWWNIQHVVEE